MNANVSATVLMASALLAPWASAQPCNPTTMPPAPAQLFADDGTSCEHTFVQWSEARTSAPVTYRVWRAIGGDLDGTEMVADGLLDTHFYDADAFAGAQYTYWAQAVSATGCASELSAADWGFRLPTEPQLIEQPNDETVSPGANAAFHVSSRFASAIQWRKDGMLIEDDGHFSGASSFQLVIHNADASDIAYYDAVLISDCGSICSDAAALLVGGQAPCRLCPADYNNDGGVDQGDLEAFFADWEQGAPCADTSRDGGVDGNDVDAFVTMWMAGHC